MKNLTLLLCSLTLLAACGQKGPLYLPEQPPSSKPYSECDVADAPCRAANATQATAPSNPKVPATETPSP